MNKITYETDARERVMESLNWGQSRCSTLQVCCVQMSIEPA